jgi:hypothetical protein
MSYMPARLMSSLQEGVRISVIPVSRSASSGHAVHVCAAARPRDSRLCTGVAASCAAGPACVGVGPNSIWPGSCLGRQSTWERCFEGSRRRSSIPACGGARSGGGRRRGEGHEKANGF